MHRTNWYSRQVIGTYRLGEDPAREDEEIKCIRTLVTDFGASKIDTAEMYGAGKAELLVGKAIRGLDRSRLQIIGKVLPENANCIRQSCIASLSRLNVSYFDLYLLHWRADANLPHVVRQMESLVDEGLIRGWGVSNFDTADMEDLFSAEEGNRCKINQVLYNLQSRGIEYDLIPWCSAHGVEIYAYSSIGHSATVKQKMMTAPSVNGLAEKYHVARETILLAFAFHNQAVHPIFKVSRLKHLDELMKVHEISLTEADVALLSADFPTPTRKVALEKI